MSNHPMRTLTDRLGQDIKSFLTDSHRRLKRTDSSFQRDRKNIGGLAEMLSNISPRSHEGHHVRKMSIEEETQYFHQKNQAFLHKAEAERAKLRNAFGDLSPQTR